MTYLGFPRLHFSGRFQADPSTVNNDPEHFDDTKFKSNYQQLETKPGTNGWWNPMGSGDWRFADCQVNKVYYQDGTSCDDPNQDPVIGMEINPPQSGVKGKLVDLDPENQNVSQIWGFQIYLGHDKTYVFQGDFQVVALADLFNRVVNGGGLSGAGAFYQSVIKITNFDGLSNSKFIQELDNPKQLSIKFTVDGFDGDIHSPDFTWGRVVGVIGPYEEAEPYNFVPGRRLLPTQNSPLNYAPCIIYKHSKKLLVDLANSLQTEKPGGIFKDIGKLQVAMKRKKNQYEIIGPIEYLATNWYENEAGIQEFSLPTGVYDIPLAVIKSEEEPGQTVHVEPDSVYLLEDETGLFARAEQFVFRLSSNDDDENIDQTTLYAYKFGEPVSNKEFHLQPDPYLVNSQQKQGPISGPKPATPNSGLMVGKDKHSFQELGQPVSVTTDQNGQAIIYLKGNLQSSPRKYIDGQVYGVSYTTSLENASDILNVLVWTKYDIPESPTWIDDVQPIFQQYANLYPVMKNFVDLGDYVSVNNRLDMLKLVFSLKPDNVNYMPVTRDLSPAKRQMLQTWLGVGQNTDKSPLYMSPIDTKDKLKEALQKAIELEHATIPTYLCALYSIKPGYNQEVAAIIRSVVIEEMLHMALACNLLVSIGGKPQINTPQFVPQYPGPLPYDLRSGLIVSLKKCSIEHIRDVFLQIEEPELTMDPTPHQHGLTIGYLYAQIQEAITTLSDKGEISFGHTEDQLTKWYDAHTINRGEMVVVKDLTSAIKAITTIVKQGEGASGMNPTDDPEQIVSGDDPTGKYRELAHFYKFEEIVNGRRLVLQPQESLKKTLLHLFHGPLTIKGSTYSFTGAEIPFAPEGVFPMRDNPSLDSFPAGSKAYNFTKEFNLAYFSMLSDLHQVFNRPSGSTQTPDQLLKSAIGKMFSLEVKAQKLMETPIPGTTETAGPSFEYPEFQ
ncbi:MAG: hypothetical protein F6J96_10455 [Symploca sp. SIO1C2]|nr:hypothetical protein [Symploca sp. SIO1C2]